MGWGGGKTTPWRKEKKTTIKREKSVREHKACREEGSRTKALRRNAEEGGQKAGGGGTKSAPSAG